MRCRSVLRRTSCDSVSCSEKPVVGIAFRRARKLLIAGVLAVDCRERVLVQPVVVAIVAVGRRALGVSLEVGLVLLLEQRVLSGDARLGRAWGGAEGRRENARPAAGDKQQKKELVVHTRNGSTNRMHPPAPRPASAQRPPPR